MAELLKVKGVPASVRTVNLAGEPLSSRLVEQIYEQTKVERIYDLYGPSEDTTYSTFALRRPNAPATIGRPISNTRVYILDGQFDAVPVGVAGELYIGGDGLARGYWDRPELTAEKFVGDPFGEEPGSRLYRTGDLCRYRADGEMEFLGRVDQQVKIRGFRIELGEIESVLGGYAGVKDAVVVVREEPAGDKRLVGYVARQAGAQIGVEELRNYLKAKLPDYMVPGQWVMLEALPLNANGKVDRRALPEPQAPGQVRGDFMGPRTELERLIAGVWQQVLGVEKVDVQANFFDLGGHSLLLVRVHSKLRELLKRDLTIIELFKFPTVDSLAEHLSPGSKAAELGWLHRRRKVVPGQSIAIIGMAGCFPGAKDVHEFWSNLARGVESISFFSAQELEAAGLERGLVEQPNYVRARGFLEGSDLFDAQFFGYSAREAELIDPQQRLFLEQAWAALENAGYDSMRHDGAIGLYAGLSFNSYVQQLANNPQVLAAVGGFQTLLGSDKDFLPTRVSYKLNFKGPSVTVQTACSTSLVAVHMACQSLVNGECDLALAGGVSVSVPAKSGYMYQAEGIGSPDGHCRAFDEKGRGQWGAQALGSWCSRGWRRRWGMGTRSAR